MIEDIELKFFPWEKGDKPYFVNPEGFEWYVDKDTLSYMRKEDRNEITIDNLYPFLVKKDDDITRVIVDDKQNIIYENKGWEAVLYYVDTIKLNKHFDGNDKKDETIRKRKKD
jgi:hypothetical protein